MRRCNETRPKCGTVRMLPYLESRVRVEVESWKSVSWNKRIWTL